MNNNIEYSKYPTASAIPEPASMIETFRAIGYSIETAIADIVDNSISAESENVWISFEWKGSETWIAIEDDGFGMTNDELIQAMRPGSKNPLDERGISDLGRFGLGLKTASFSQCRKLSVISKKKNSDVYFRTWDLNFVNQIGRWELIKYIPDNGYQHKPDKLVCGTTVIWNEIDRLVNNNKREDNRALNKFLLTMEQVKKHLSIVFHRFIESRSINIFFQGRKVEAWDPFLINESATQGFPEEIMQNGKVIVRGFVLPHKSKISEETYHVAEGIKGWNEHQGFYIYRNERLLIAGDWLGLYRKEPHFKLARIQIDITSSSDAQWQIDIKKSVARLPHPLYEQLKSYSCKVRNQAVEVYRHKGRTVVQLPGQKFVPFWTEHKRGNKWFYKINRNHPIIDKIGDQAASEPNKAIETLLRFIEETIPAKSIYIKESTDEHALGNPFENTDCEPVRILMDQVFNKLISEGKTVSQAKSIILNIEPFNLFPHFLEFIN